LNTRNVSKVFVGVVLASATSIASAAIISNNVSFSAKNQNMFLAPFPTLSFEKDYSFSSLDILGGSEILGYEVPTIEATTTITADSGTVKRSTFNGVVDIDYQNVILQPGLTSLSLDFTGALSVFDSAFGVQADIEAKFTTPAGNSFALQDAFGPLLSIDDSNYISQLADQTLFGEDNIVSVGPSLQNALEFAGETINYTATVGGELTVKQETVLSNKQIIGKIIATHEASNKQVEKTFSLDALNSSPIDLMLDLSGKWDLTLSDLSFSSDMDHSFSFVPTLKAGIEFDLNSECAIYCSNPKWTGIREVSRQLSFEKEFEPFSPVDFTSQSLAYEDTSVFSSFSIDVGTDRSDDPTKAIIDKGDFTTVGGIDWLDWDLTKEMMQSEALDYYLGYRVATGLEMETLMNTFFETNYDFRLGIETVSINDSDMASKASIFNDLFGRTSLTQSLALVEGIGVVGGFAGVYGFDYMIYAGFGNESKLDDYDSFDNNYGIALVRDRITLVSEPSTLALVALGLIGFASRRFKKQPK